jgi:hypothetical protein
MNRIQSLVRGLVLSLIFLGVAGVSRAQEKPVDPQVGPRISMIDELWRQTGQLQRQIFGLEVGVANPRSTPRSTPLPGNIAEQSPDNALQKKADGKSGDVQKPTPAQKTVPGPEKPQRPRDGSSAAQIDQMWRQITELQKAILKLEIAEMNPRLIAGAAPAANSSGRTEKPDITSTRNPERTSGSGPNREDPPRTIPGSENAQQPRGTSNEVQIGQLWQQIGQLYKRIVALELGDMGPRDY